MKTIKDIYRIGNGPSSSHTMAPKVASENFKSNNKKAHSFRVTLYGSLAATGRGHLTDKAIINAFEPQKIEIMWKPSEELPEHPNGMFFEALSDDGKVINSKRVYSIGGGALKEEGRKEEQPEIYDIHTMEEVLNKAESGSMMLWELIEKFEGQSIWEYLEEVWQIMQDAIDRGTQKDGVLPGDIKLERRSRSFYLKAKRNNEVFQRAGLIYSYALAIAEENASGNIIVTAPTCGSSGVLPAVLKYLQDFFSFSDKDIYRALATAGLFGNVVKTNASISGAEVGCQGEVGTACAMTAAAATQLIGGSLYQIEYAAEMGLEHHLGLTCDPVEGLVQIPCIERNAFAATNALDCADYAIMSDGRHRITFDEVVAVMKQTGMDMKSKYRETSQGGLAKYGYIHRK